MRERNRNDKQKILIIDDSQFNRQLLIDMLGESYDCLEAANGKEGVEQMLCQPDIALVLLDMVMPDMDGFAVLEQMRRYRWVEQIPVIVISAEQTDSFMERAYDLGATDYIGRPFHAQVVRRRVENTLTLYAKQRWLTHLFSEQMLEKEKLSSLLLGIFGSVVEYHNGEDGQHTLQVRTVTEALLRQLVKITDRYQLNESDIVRIGMASALHDIGKSRVPGELLNKPGKLTPEEFSVVKTHTVIGAEILRDLSAWQDEPLLETAYEICRWHHERWDGNGYPDGLRGEDIPISAQAVALADAYSALTAVRSYKKAFDRDTAVSMILAGKCGAFNPLLLKCLTDLGDRLTGEEGGQPVDGHDDLQDSRRLSAELLNKGGIGQTPVQSALDYSQEKLAFYQEQCGGIQFEYNVASGRLRVMDHMEPMECLDLNDDGGEWEHLLREEDRQHLRELVEQTTPEAPGCGMDLPFSVGLEQRMHHLEARVIWTQDEPRRRVYVIGRLYPLNGIVERAPIIDLTTESGTLSELTFKLKGLERVFDMVRVLDPVGRTALKLDQDGRLTDGADVLWEKSGGYDDSLALAAYERRGRVSKLRFSGTSVFHVAAQYLELDGQPRILELTSRVDDGRWVDEGERRILLEP